jgi:predicted nucleotide-binding protein
MASAYGEVSVSLEFLGARSTLSIKGRTRAEVERIFDIFEGDLPVAELPDPESAIQRSVRIFIAHGRNPSWRDLKDHLQDQHGFAVTAYEIGVRAGYSIQEVLEEMVNAASFALLVHTGEDETGAGEALQARQNVVHETGLFQGRLGFRRAIILREDGCEGFSNVIGTAELRFSHGNIREAFGDVLATIYREFGAPRRDT